MTNSQFHRTEILLGHEAMNRLQQMRVIIFGIGGVGSSCAEALVRTGLGHLTMVDSDLVCITNTNRQLQAFPDTVGRPKVEEMASRLRQISPDCDIVTRMEPYTPDNRDTFELEKYDVVVDAIDSLRNKIDLLATCAKREIPVIASMGAACKLDPSRIRTASIWKTEGCPLARAVRTGLRKQQIKTNIPCVFSPEVVPNQIMASPCGTGDCFCPKKAITGEENSDTWCAHKAVVNGSLIHVTGTFGFHLAGIIIRYAYSGTLA